MWRVLYTFLIFRPVYAKLLGEHVCLREESYTVNVTDNYIRNVTERNYHWCLNIPPRCSFYTVKEINNIRTVERNKTRIIEECCPGYFELRHECILCQQCKHGVCTNQTCQCFSGYEGDNCDTECGVDSRGENCERKCNCTSSQCDVTTGKCIFKDFMKLPERREEEETEMNFYFNNVSEIRIEKDLESYDNENNSKYFKSFVSTENEKPKINHNLEHKTSTISDLLAAIEKNISHVRVQNNFKFIESETPSLPKRNIKEDERKLLKTSSNFNESVHSERNNLVNIISIVAATTASVIIVAIIILLINHIKSKQEENISNKKAAGVSTVAVYTTSIFHTPLPNLPDLENSSHRTSIDYQNHVNDSKSFEKYTIYSLNVPNQSEKGSQEYIYDHPPSTGSYRATSVVDSLDNDTNYRSTVAQVEPVYDEIPCRGTPWQIDQSADYNKTFKSTTLYINTCEKTKF